MTGRGEGMTDQQAKLIEQIAEDYNAVLKEAKSMGCKNIKALYNIPIENIELIVQSLEKQIPKSIVGNEYNTVHVGDTVNGMCPECMTDFVCITPRMYKARGFGYCKCCGQKMDWSEK